MTLQSRLLGVFAQYKRDPRVGIFTTEVILRSRGYDFLPDNFHDFILFGFLTDRSVIQDTAQYLVSCLSGQPVGKLYGMPVRLRPRQEECAEHFTLGMAQYARQAPLVPWIARTIANWLKRLPSGNTGVGLLAQKKHASELLDFHTHVVSTFPNSLNAIADWAYATHPNLMALSWTEVVEAVAVWHTSLLQGKRKAMPGEIVYYFPDGWTVQQLVTMDQLKSETAAMGHCVGTSDAYLREIEAGQIAIFSMRDSEGRSVVTFEVELNKPIYRIHAVMTDDDPDFELRRRPDGHVEPVYADILSQAKLANNALPSTPEICDRIIQVADALDWEYVGPDAKWISDLREC